MRTQVEFQVGGVVGKRLALAMLCRSTQDGHIIKTSSGVSGTALARVDGCPGDAALALEAALRHGFLPCVWRFRICKYFDAVVVGMCTDRLAEARINCDYDRVNCLTAHELEHAQSSVRDQMQFNIWGTLPA